MELKIFRVKRLITKLLLLLFIYSWSHEVESQSIDNLDSLKTALNSAEGGERIRILNLLASNLRESEQELALNYALEAEMLSRAASDASGESLAKENIGWIYYRRGRWQRAFDYSKEAYELAIAANNMNVAARLLNSMGALYYEQHNFDKAIEQFKKGFLLSKEQGDLYTQIRSLNNVAFNFSEKGEYDSALYYARYSIQINQKAGSPYLTAFANRVIGDIYFKRGEYDSAAQIFEGSLEDSRIQNVKTTEASVTHRLGATYLKLGRLEDAKKILLEGIEVSKENKFLDELAKNYKYLAEVYEAKGNITKAYENQKTYLLLNDSLVNKGNRDRIALLQGMFQDNLDQSELNLLRAQNENQAQRIQLNRRNNLIVGIAVFLIVGLAIWLYILNRNINKYNKDLLKQKEKIKKQNNDLEAKSLQLEKINETKNKLFSILGHDLKGPVGQVKSVVDLLMRGALTKDEFDQLLISLNKDIDTVHFTLNNTLKWSMSQMEGFKLKRSCFNLTEIVNSTISLIDPQVKGKNLTINNKMDNDVSVFADMDLIEVVVRNILNNAVKFSKMNDSIEITSTSEDNMMKWCVNDHGIGMSKSQITHILGKDYAITDSQKGTNEEKGSGLGLQLCKEFIRMSGGDIFIQSTEGTGTKICVTIPKMDLVHEANSVGRKEIAQS